jgi:two-component system, NtrC family, sensor kinase
MKTDADGEPEGGRFALLGRLVAGVAHDLNNYLGVVDVSLAMGQRRLEGGPHDSDLELARRATDHALRLIRSLVDYARGGEPPAGEVDLGDVVRRTLALFDRSIPPEVRVSIDADRAVARVRGVSVELEQLVLNLVLNACDAMCNGGELHVRVRDGVAGTVTLEVADTGCGVATGASTATGTTSPSAKSGRGGQGLGLGIVRSVCERHGAELRVAHRDGGGTAVTVVLAANQTS